MATIRVSLNEDVERLLEDLKQDYPALDYPELFKLALSELHRRREFERRREWVASLPTLEISEEEARSIAEARKEQGKVVSLEELKGELKASLND